MTEKRKLPIKIGELALNGEFEGWTFVGRTNPPMELVDHFLKGRVDVGLGPVVYTWNFVDENGEPMPQPNDVREKDGQEAVDKLLKKLPIDLLMAMGKALTDRIFDVPKN